jgi:hypothetical protein
MRTINLEEILFAEVDKLRKERVNVRLVPNEKMKEYQEWEYFMNAMKEACRQTLELAAENTTICLNKYSHGIIKESINLGQEICTERQNEYYECDKNSILNTITQVK